MNDSALRIPFILSPDEDAVFRGDGHTLREIDIVAYQDRVGPSQFDDKALVTRSFVVVREDADHSAGYCDHETGVLRFECSSNRVGSVIRRVGGLGCLAGIEPQTAGQHSCCCQRNTEG